MTDGDVAEGTTLAWRCAAVSVRGASHHRTGRPNQDAAAAVLENDGLVILAVADGHGSAPHARSDQGSRIAVQVATAAVRDAARAWRDGGDAAAIARAAEALPARIIADWRSAVADALHAAPLSADETQRLAMINLDDSAAYGATLVLAVLHPHGGALIQLGDGDIHLLDAAGRISKPLPDEDAPGEATSSLCLPEAETAVRMRLLSAAEVAGISAVVASTDGLVKSYSDKRALRSSVTALAAGLAGGAEAAFVTEVSSWLPQVSSAGSGDDISVAVAARESADAAWVTPDEPPAVESATATSRRDDAHPQAGTQAVPRDATNGTMRWIVAAIVLLLLGAAGYIWREPIAAAIAHWTAPQLPAGRAPPSSVPASTPVPPTQPPAQPPAARPSEPEPRAPAPAPAPATPGPATSAPTPAPAAAPEPRAPAAPTPAPSEMRPQTPSETPAPEPGGTRAPTTETQP